MTNEEIQLIRRNGEIKALQEAISQKIYIIIEGSFPTYKTSHFEGFEENLSKVKNAVDDIEKMWRHILILSTNEIKPLDAP